MCMWRQAGQLAWQHKPRILIARSRRSSPDSGVGEARSAAQRAGGAPRRRVTVLLHLRVYKQALGFANPANAAKFPAMELAHRASWELLRQRQNSLPASKPRALSHPQTEEWCVLFVSCVAPRHHDFIHSMMKIFGYGSYDNKNNGLIVKIAKLCIART